MKLRDVRPIEANCPKCKTAAVWERQTVSTEVGKSVIVKTWYVCINCGYEFIKH